MPVYGDLARLAERAACPVACGGGTGLARLQQSYGSSAKLTSCRRARSDLGPARSVDRDRYRETRGQDHGRTTRWGRLADNTQLPVTKRRPHPHPHQHQVSEAVSAEPLWQKSPRRLWSCPFLTPFSTSAKRQAGSRFQSRVPASSQVWYRWGRVCGQKVPHPEPLARARVAPRGAVVPSVKYPRLVWVRPQALGARQAHTGTRATTVQVRDDVKVLRYPVHRRQPAFRCASLLSAFCTRHARSCPPPVHAASPSPLTLPSFRLARLSGKRGGQDA